MQNLYKIYASVFLKFLESQTGVSNLSRTALERTRIRATPQLAIHGKFKLNNPTTGQSWGNCNLRFFGRGVRALVFGCSFGKEGCPLPP